MKKNGIEMGSPSTADKPDTTAKTIKDVYDNRINELSEFIRATMDNVQIATKYDREGKPLGVKMSLQAISECLLLADNTLRTIKDLSLLVRFPDEDRK